jgi:thiol-disulfide isomerase/thioredoxin
MRNIRLFAVGMVIVLIFTSSCSSSKKSGTDSHELYEPESVVPDTFVFPQVPASLTDPDERAQYLIHHFWDRFDFADSMLTKKPAITEQAFVDYIHLLRFLPNEESAEVLRHTLKRAEANSSMFRYFVSLMEKYFYDPNSPFRNEEYYIPVLQEAVGSSLLEEADRSRYQFQLEMALQNRVGMKANNFSFTLASGETRTLHEINSQYLLLIFSNPGCPTCEAVTRQLNSSSALNRALAMNSPTRTMLTILTIYPDNDLEVWREHLPHLPQQWLHAYDPGMAITRERLYDIKAIPTIYLLDSNKKVLLKDSSIEAVESFFSIMN